jgi:peptidoglycan hydrolase CwlO-like protein
MLKFFENKSFLVLAFISVGCLAISIVSSQKFQRTKNDLNDERYNRMVAEEKLEQMKTKVRMLESSTQKSQADVNQLNLLLQRNEGAISNLKLELEKTERLNQVLQEQLKNALVSRNALVPPQ